MSANKTALLLSWPTIGLRIDVCGTICHHARMRLKTQLFSSARFRCYLQGRGRWILIHDGTPRFVATIYEHPRNTYLDSQLLWCEQPAFTIPPDVHAAADEAIVRALTDRCGAMDKGANL
ncbi:hypothetical protein OAS39_02920 [Pirellulales bacterium]|nr:hypothetical protein [Pirellulales bacterium]